MTNREKINNMSNVELSNFICETFMETCIESVCTFKFNDTNCNKYCCAEGVLRWLEQEVEE